MPRTGPALRRTLALALTAATAVAGVSAAAPPATPEAAPAQAAGHGGGGGGHGGGGGADQVVTWGASADTVPGSLDDQTVRNLVHTSIGGRNVRVEVSNAFGTEPVTFDSVYAGIPADEDDPAADLAPGSNHEVTFSGSSSVTVPPGAQALSDPVDWDVPADTTLAVSVHAAGEQGALTGHNLAMSTTYVSEPGDVAADESGDAYTQTEEHWYWVTGLVVDAPRQVDTLALLGDSITDGHSSTVDANHRWPDLLADRLAEEPLPHRYGVMNQGISGNRVLVDSAGVSAQARFDRDVLAKPDVETVVLLEGINDIGNGDATSADQLVAAYRQLIARAHAADVCIVGATLTPFEGAFYYSEAKEEVRAGVNEWIRTSGEFDAVIDFDAAVRDPENPLAMLPAYDIGDNLHPNDAGYQAMADAVDLDVLDCDR
ncbi:SGNH/GDSL hydrolase family protein [Isoptericola cucumis]|uniref:SGNH hydrolase n=2 Tax=Isoptericola cucumis TaxID=1776856 RepID=A0ABQ2BAC2_9MICO|nr:SGNH/GDSL hydrolase family protein [Isoptericola cucumis]GGI11722.1 SGNH hydrolase [Isoptericola cucumis]